MPNIVNAGVIAIIAGFAALAVVGAVDEFDVRREGTASTAEADPEAPAVTLDEPSATPEVELPLPGHDAGDGDRHEKRGKGDDGKGDDGKRDRDDEEKKGDDKGDDKGHDEDDEDEDD